MAMSIEVAPRSSEKTLTRKAIVNLVRMQKYRLNIFEGCEIDGCDPYPGLRAPPAV